MPDSYRDRDRDQQQRVIVPGEAAMPQDLAAERSVLSAMLLSQDVLQESLIELNERDFYLHANRAIYSAMHDMFDKSLPVDPVSLADYLRSAGELERVGGMSYLLELNNNTLSLANWRHHAEMLRRDDAARDHRGFRAHHGPGLRCARRHQGGRRLCGTHDSLGDGPRHPFQLLDP